MIKSRYLTILSLVLLNLTICQAQQIRWADFVDYQYNQYDDLLFSANQAVGPPDAFPAGEIHEKAFRLKFKESYGSLILGFNEPVYATHLVIIENNDPGRIVNVALIDERGKKYLVQEAQPQKTDDPARALSFRFPRTPYKVKKVEISINSIPAPGWHQIDAVGLVDLEENSELENALKTFGQFNVDESIVFTSRKKSLGGSVNTYYTETKPVISPDGRTLYFARQFYKGNINGERDPQDIYVSRKLGDGWTEAENAGYPLNDKKGNGVCSVSPDGNTLLLIGRDGPMISRRKKGKWSEPEALNIDDFYNKSRYQDYYLGGDGQTLLLSLERDDSYGAQDLYVSFREDAKRWGAPVHLGPVINTVANDFAPFLAADNKTLYFASEGHGGFGESDIFYTKRLDDSWTNWSPPKNLGKEINTPGWDAYYAVSAAGDYAYFVSNGGNPAEKLISEYEDIFKIELPGEFKPEPVALVKGRVLNAETKEPLSADILFETLPGGTDRGHALSNPDDGGFSLIFNSGAQYAFMAKAEGFIAQSDHLDLRHIDEYAEVQKDLLLIPLAEGQIMQLNNLFFEQSRANLLPESQPELQRLYALLIDNPAIEIELGGHTDSQGSASANMELSRRRVEVVRDFLLEKGIDRRRILTKGYGETKPLYDNSQEASRQRNRRVEVKILKY